MSKYYILKYIVRLVKSVNYLKAALLINKFKQLFLTLNFSSYTYIIFIKNSLQPFVMITYFYI